MIQKLFSYLYPIKIFKKKSARSKVIEVTWANGELVLDSENTNYSYGSLQRILRYGLRNIGYDKVLQMEHILVLGVAGGSVIKTLVDEINYKGKITGVEIDPEMIQIANQYFNLNEIKQLEIIIDDAFEFVLKTKDRYDLIIIDIFEDTNMPNFLFEKFFSERVCFLLKDQGFILFNTMILDEAHNVRNRKYITEINAQLFTSKMLPRIEVHNELIIIEKVA
ncbi:methyltransferase domain-containing protein [Flavobacterium sp. WLB]|uniref:Methyltransferase domain-containing protein n=1 Tax=Flavobacterium panici TaxID=2654843 RepID=A0A9N8J8M6_9FLAO|nr:MULTISPECIES: fused MFS/spermidine synthase [Flavobacterium]KOP36999.1 spermidine synthase [Flavobacterium sp. VMW]OWU89717.1 spermidine synthase [Flavobacterium sp. NLM]PUU68256.1 methyltransferase domain-containing protein [Flavobacterium sp. WLB]UUF13311.1 fused MFS/spermidine synthase [Flavobacterium panici]CAC9977021.1 methyltransferase domain-containing protein [Flavobacterium panici]